jgi:hypothetical protein
MNSTKVYKIRARKVVYRAVAIPAIVMSLFRSPVLDKNCMTIPNIVPIKPSGGMRFANIPKGSRNFDSKYLSLNWKAASLIKVSGGTILE